MDNLFDIRAELNMMLSQSEQCDPETGEVTELDAERFAQLEGQIDENLLELARKVLNVRGMIALREEHIVEMKVKLVKDEKRITRYVNLIDMFLAPEGVIEAPDVLLKRHKLPDKLDVFAEGDIPEAFVVNGKPDKAKLLRVLKGGGAVRGVQLLSGRSKVVIE